MVVEAKMRITVGGLDGEFGNTPLTALPPAASVVGTVAAEVLAANAERQGLLVVNLGAGTVSLGFGYPAVLYAGVTLCPMGSYSMDSDSFSLQSMSAVSSAADSKLSIQEFN